MLWSSQKPFALHKSTLTGLARGPNYMPRQPYIATMHQITLKSVEGLPIIEHMHSWTRVERAFEEMDCAGKTVWMTSQEA